MVTPYILDTFKISFCLHVLVFKFDTMNILLKGAAMTMAGAMVKNDITL